MTTQNPMDTFNLVLTMRNMRIRKYERPDNSPIYATWMDKTGSGLMVDEELLGTSENLDDVVEFGLANWLDGYLLDCRRTRACFDASHEIFDALGVYSFPRTLTD